MITISDEIRQCCPSLQLGIVCCEVKVQPSDISLLEYIEVSLQKLQEELVIEQISQLPVAQQTRRGYKAIGKDPARYRPSAEALLRRVVQGKGLYRINNVVDTLNLISVQTAYAIGGYDMDQIKGDIILGIGEAGETYQGIGRGDLNIDRLSVLRDDQGAFGSPTSDSERTSVRNETQRFMMVFFNFEGSDLLKTAMDLANNLLSQFANATEITQQII